MFETTVRPDQFGKIRPCRLCNKVGTIGQKLYMENIGTEENKRWIACIELECFEKQKANPDAIPKKTSQFTPKSSRLTTDELLLRSKAFLEFAPQAAIELAEKIIPKECPDREKNLCIARENAVTAFSRIWSA